MRITFLIEKSNSCDNEICCFLSCQEKSNSRVDENYCRRELLFFFEVVATEIHAILV